MTDKQKAIRLAINPVEAYFEEYETVEALEFLEVSIDNAKAFFEEQEYLNLEEVYDIMKKEEASGNAIFLLVNDETYNAWISMPEPYGVFVEAINEKHLRFDFVQKVTAKEFYDTMR